MNYDRFLIISMTHTFDIQLLGCFAASRWAVNKGPPHGKGRPHQVGFVTRGQSWSILVQRKFGGRGLLLGSLRAGALLIRAPPSERPPST